jgi:uncharacterized protein YdhG (YjbR/CyaY superfamily)
VNTSTTQGIDEYLMSVSDEHRAVLERLRRQIRRAAPEATETISYRIPTFKYRGRPLLYFAAHKDHCSIYPVTEAMIAVAGDEIAPRRTGKGTLRFTAVDPLPSRLVSKIVKARKSEIEAGGR